MITQSPDPSAAGAIEDRQAEGQLGRRADNHVGGKAAFRLERHPKFWRAP
jgi:hypothetical protein